MRWCRRLPCWILLWAFIWRGAAKPILVARAVNCDHSKLRGYRNCNAQQVTKHHHHGWDAEDGAHLRRGHVSRSSLLAGVLSALGVCVATMSSATAKDAMPKTALITGANSGIGLATATELARRGWTIVPACRSMERADDAAASIDTVVPGANVRILDARCELADLQSVGKFGAALRRSGVKLDALVLNAGIDGAPFAEKTVQGHEMHFGVNHLGHFALWLAARDLLDASSPDGARVVSVTSSASLDANLDLDDLDWQRRPYSSQVAYGTSKACNVLFADELTRRSASSGARVIANAVDPGPTLSQIVRYKLPQRAAQRRNMSPEAMARQAKKLSLNTPDEAAAGLVWLADTPEGASKSGELYVGPSLAIPLAAPWRTEAMARGLWEKSEALVSPFIV